MAGTKGHSGVYKRRSPKDDEKRLRVIDKCWDYIEKVLNDDKDEFTKAQKLEVALKITVKDLPTQLTGDNGNPLLPPIINFTSTTKKPEGKIDG